MKNDFNYVPVGRSDIFDKLEVVSWHVDFFVFTTLSARIPAEEVTGRPGVYTCRAGLRGGPGEPVLEPPPAGCARPGAAEAIGNLRRFPRLCSIAAALATGGSFNAFSLFTFSRLSIVLLLLL